jgi:dihydropteroate synthase
VFLTARHFKFTFPRPALVMGILNVTPDSFSDGGEFFQTEAAVKRAWELVEQGADLIDLGGESTRPGSEPVSEEEELRRILPVLEQLSGKLPIPISIDTMKVGVARAALALGASIVNDVGASRDDSAMWNLVRETGAGYVCVHMRGTPLNMQNNPTYTDVVSEVKKFFEERLLRLIGHGVRLHQIIFDPGIGFGKKIEHNLQLIASVEAFTQLDRPLLLGVSRKSFLSKVGGGQERLVAGLACACFAAVNGVQMIRTHDVAQTVQAIRMIDAIKANRTH